MGFLLQIPRKRPGLNEVLLQHPEARQAWSAGVWKQRGSQPAATGGTGGQSQAGSPTVWLVLQGSPQVMLIPPARTIIMALCDPGIPAPSPTPVELPFPGIMDSMDSQTQSRDALSHQETQRDPKDAKGHREQLPPHQTQIHHPRAISENHSEISNGVGKHAHTA